LCCVTFCRTDCRMIWFVDLQPNCGSTSIELGCRILCQPSDVM